MRWISRWISAGLRWGAPLAWRGSGAVDPAGNSPSLSPPGPIEIGVAWIDEKDYPKSRKLSESEMSEVCLVRDKFHGEWNYAILPQSK